MQIAKLKKNFFLYHNNLQINNKMVTKQLKSEDINKKKCQEEQIQEMQVQEMQVQEVLESNKKIIKPQSQSHILLQTYIKYGTNKIKNNNSINNSINTTKSILIDDDNYYAEIDNFNIFYKSNKNEINSNPKIGFRYLCYKHINDIRKLQLPEIKLNNNYEAVLIEYRCMPHLEFLIRNMIHKLGSEWSHTVVCGTLNYNFMINMCNKIDKNIKIIKTKFDNLMPPYQYSEFLATEEFWNMFVGNKILLYQEDSIIFKSNINDFIEYDYVGAPWRKNCGLNTYDVGNGGFSLRTKQKMIDVIKKYPYTYKNRLYEDVYFTKNMINNKQNKLFEDIYFTKNMINNNIGKIAKWDVASNFSSELIYNPESLGGHAFWLSNKNWKQHVYDKIINAII